MAKKRGRALASTTFATTALPPGLAVGMPGVMAAMSKPTDMLSEFRFKVGDGRTVVLPQSIFDAVDSIIVTVIGAPERPLVYVNGREVRRFRVVDAPAQ